jgi:hypothetical protein
VTVAHTQTDCRNETGDCRSETGISVGLIDGVIAVCRILNQRDLSDGPIAEALADLRSDEDVRSIIPTGV